MPRTAPDTSASTAATRKITRNQVGRIVASVPMGSAVIPSESLGSDPASSRP